MQILPDDTIYELSIPDYVLKKDKIVNFTTYKNEEMESSLFDVIWNEWGEYLIQYRSEKVEVRSDGITRIKFPEPVYDVINAILKFFKTECSYMDIALVKLLSDKEGIIRASGKMYEEDGKKWFHKPNRKTKAGAEALRKRKLTKYVVPTKDGYPDYENIGWIGPTITSFREFHGTFSELFKERMGWDEDYEKAYKVLERREKGEISLVFKN